MNVSRYEDVRALLRRDPRIWLVTGAAGFIGSNLLEALLGLGQTVVALDNLATGHTRNFDEVRRIVGSAWERVKIVAGDIRDFDTCQSVLRGVDHVLHQAALGSVSRSIADPISSNAVNVSGFLNMLTAARDAGVRSFVYAASSSTYGDHPGLPKVEDRIGRPLSPYAVTKYINELYADVFAQAYGFRAVGLRYFNVFGPRQDPDGAYAAVIPRWIAAMLRNEAIVVNGDGETSRDFCFVANVVQANLLAALSDEFGPEPVYNVAGGERISLNSLFLCLRDSLAMQGICYDRPPIHRDFRLGDVRHSLADIGKAKRGLGYAPSHSFAAGITEALSWYIAALGRSKDLTI